MAQCPYCQKHVADNLVRCPHCFTRLALAGASDSVPSRDRPGANRLKSKPSRLIKPGTLLRLPASRLALLAFLGIVAVLCLAASAFAIFRPDSARALLSGAPTPVPPTPRPTPTPSPPPTATPEWISRQGHRASYTIAFPPDWIVLDFASVGWKRTLRRLSADFPWLRESFPDDKLQDEADAETMWTFDPQRAGDFSIRCWLDRSLAGLTAPEIRETVGKQLLQVPPRLGGRIQGGTRTELVEIDGQGAVAFELVVLPGPESDFSEPVTLQFYLLADEKQGYRIEVLRIEQDPTLEEGIVEAVVASFRRPEGLQ